MQRLEVEQKIEAKVENEQVESRKQEIEKIQESKKKLEEGLIELVDMIKTKEVMLIV